MNYFSLPMRYAPRDAHTRVIDTGDRRYIAMRACAVPDGQVVIYEGMERVAMRYKNGTLVLRTDKSKIITLHANSQQWVEVTDRRVKPSPHLRNKPAPGGYRVPII